MYTGFNTAEPQTLARGAAQKLAWSVGVWKLEEAKLGIGGRLGYK